MPTFTTIALETLLEPRNSYKNNSSTLKQQHSTATATATAAAVFKSVQNHKNQVRNGEEEEERGNTTRKSKPPTPNHIYISPALYTTPEPTPILDSSSSGSVSPSPYVFNRKGRGRKNAAAARKIDVVEETQQQEKISSSSSNDDDESCFSNGNGIGDEIVQVKEEEIVDDNLDRVVMELDEDDFVDPRCDSLSVASSIDLNDIGRQVVENLNSSVSNQGEFFDANEDFSSDGSISNIPSCGRSIESELRATKVSLLEEIDRRKTAEDALHMMYSQWQRVRDLLLSEAGLTFPTLPNATTPMKFDGNSLEQFSQEVIVARFVAEAIGKGEARAEAELAAEVVIESKDQELSRLRDRLQYYEAVNSEMSQRNLEVVEVARRQRQTRKGRHKWFWSCIGISIAIGASVIAYSYLPQTSEHQSSLAASDGPPSNSSSN